MRRFAAPVLSAVLCAGAVNFAQGAKPAGDEQNAAVSGLEETAQREKNFLSEQADNPSTELAAAMLADSDAWLHINADKKQADAVLIFKADQQIKLEQYKDAVVTLMHQIYEFPDSTLNFNAKTLLNAMLDKRIDRKLRQPILDSARAVDPTASKMDRLAQFLTEMSAIGGDVFYDPLLAEYENFFVRYPEYQGLDKLLTSRAAMRVKKGFYLSAVFDYERVLAVYPQSKLLATAKRMTGDVYVNNLKNNAKALECYQYVVDHFPDTDDAGTSYNQMARLSEIDKQYELAVDVYEKIAKIYDGKDSARDALFSEARVLLADLNRPQDSINVLIRIADKYKSDKGFAALHQAAKTARKELRDYPQEIKMYERMVAEYPDNPESPAMLLESGKVYEKDLQDLQKAATAYQQVIDRYAGNSMAKSAEGRLKALKSS